MVRADMLKQAKKLSKALSIKLCASGEESDSSLELAESESEDRESSGIYNEDDEI